VFGRAGPQRVGRTSAMDRSIPLAEAVSDLRLDRHLDHLGFDPRVQPANWRDISACEQPPGCPETGTELRLDRTMGISQPEVEFGRLRRETTGLAEQLPELPATLLRSPIRVLGQFRISWASIARRRIARARPSASRMPGSDRGWSALTTKPASFNFALHFRIKRLT
jgi:hypothetical protein